MAPRVEYEHHPLSSYTTSRDAIHPSAPKGLPIVTAPHVERHNIRASRLPWDGLVLATWWLHVIRK